MSPSQEGTIFSTKSVLSGGVSRLRAKRSLLAWNGGGEGVLGFNSACMLRQVEGTCVVEVRERSGVED